MVEHYTTDITIHAPIARVWEAITTPHLVRQFLSGNVVSTWEKGDSIVFVNDWEGVEHRDKGRILDIRPPYLLRIAYLPVLGELEDTPENYQEITWELTSIESITTVTVMHTNIRDEFFGKRAPELWGEILRGLKSITEV